MNVWNFNCRNNQYSIKSFRSYRISRTIEKAFIILSNRISHAFCDFLQFFGRFFFSNKLKLYFFMLLFCCSNVCNELLAVWASQYSKHLSFFIFSSLLVSLLKMSLWLPLSIIHSFLHFPFVPFQCDPFSAFCQCRFFFCLFWECMASLTGIRTTTYSTEKSIRYYFQSIVVHSLKLYSIVFTFLFSFRWLFSLICKKAIFFLSFWPYAFCACFPSSFNSHLE